MSNHNTHPLAHALTISRNGINGVLKIFVGKKGAWAERPYQAFQVEADADSVAITDDKAFIDSLTFIGKTNVKNFLNVICKRFGQDFVEDATGEDGIFSVDKFCKYWSDLKSSALKLSELQEAILDGQKDYMNFIATEFTAGLTSGNPELIKQAQEKRERMDRNLNALRAEWEERKARRSKEAAAETVTAV